MSRRILPSERRQFLHLLASSVALAGCRSDRTALPPEAIPSAAAEALPIFSLATFPLARRRDERHLFDAREQPFLVHGDTAWSMLVQLVRDEVLNYLDDRRARGFNTLLVNLLEHTFAVDPPRNRQGDAPFLSASDYATPNPRYFDHAAWVLDRAAERGFLVLLAPSYIGCCDDAWYPAMVANGAQKMRDYGRYLGQRFRNSTNILWVHGGDANPARKDIVSAIAMGIRDVDRVHLHTAHTAPGFQAMDIWGNATWMDVNNVYTYEPVKDLCSRAYDRPDRMPFFLIESEYEGENRRAPDTRIRAQAWQTVLSGAMGQVVGNNPIWHFASPKPITPFRGSWQQALDSEAARSMTQLRRLLEAVSWWQLEPDVDARLLVAGRCDGHERAVAAQDRRTGLLVTYIPHRRRFQLARDALPDAPLRLRWYDPVGGRFGSAFQASVDRRRRITLSTPESPNAGGDPDWVLVVDRA